MICQRCMHSDFRICKLEKGLVKENIFYRFGFDRLNIFNEERPVVSLLFIERFYYAFTVYVLGLFRFGFY